MSTEQIPPFESYDDYLGESRDLIHKLTRLDKVIAEGESPSGFHYPFTIDDSRNGFRISDDLAKTTLITLRAQIVDELKMLKAKADEAWGVAFPSEETE